MDEINKVQEQIIQVLKASKGRPISVSEITRRINKNKNKMTTQPTVSKWVEVMKAAGKVAYSDYGNIKLVSLK